MQQELEQFAAAIRQEIDTEFMTGAASGSFREEMLTQIFVDALQESGDVEEGEVAHYQDPRRRVSGFGLAGAGERLDLFITIHNGQVPLLTVNQAEVQKAFRFAGRFLERAVAGLHQNLDEAFPSHDMAMRIYDNRTSIARVRLHLFTDGLAARGIHLTDSMVAGYPTSYQV
jgi:hypothetical protein